MTKLLVIFAVVLSIFIFSCGDSKTTSEKAESQTAILPDTSVSQRVDSLFQEMDQTKEQLNKNAEETQKAVDDLLKDF
jgi:outer membrane murein-binding lipoprotein Lpp